jgi:hypothetical protein
VRIVKLLTPSREFTGTEGVRRPPRIGDEGTIVLVYDPQTFAVEMIDENGMTVWLADFKAEELERISI